MSESIDLGLDMEIECEPLDPTDPIVRQRILEKVNHKNSNSVVIDLQSESTVYPKLEQILNSNSFSKAFKTVRGRRLVVDKIISQNADFQTLLCKDVIDGQLTLLKAARPSQIWEYYIYQKLAGREIVCNLVSFCASNDSSILELEYHPSQTLLSTFVKNNQDMSEVVVYNVALEIIKAVHKFHELGFIHCDIHQDNIIMEDNRGWKLCNFEASIDLSAFPMNQLFRMEPNEDEAALECFEMQKGLAWKYEPDWFQVAMVVHELKFPGKGFGVINSSEFSRPIQKIAQECDEKWQDLFKMLLNVDSEQNISKFLSSL